MEQKRDEIEFNVALDIIKDHIEKSNIKRNKLLNKIDNDYKKSQKNLFKELQDKIEKDQQETQAFIEVLGNHIKYE